MPYTKKNLRDKYHLGNSTLHEHLKDCGLNTKKSVFTDEEIHSIFDVAEQMRKEGYSSKEIRQHFGVGNAQATPPPSASPGGTLFTDAVAQTVKGFMQAEAREAVRKVLPLIPFIVEQEFIALIQSGEFHQSFVDYEENVRTQQRTDYYDVASYTVPNVGGLGAGEEDEEEHEEEVDDEVNVEEE
ncbi:hypothetical protein [Calothrix sp. NIES-2098]|uniref:hypothetical protein n=1 Tax=Calothrix sp. NIES-2098 TaxID=1954171 RepID=UPI000B606005|nr:hypothetical protein NIES2098_12870 [Calothrix sp. NIES-2098]